MHRVASGLLPRFRKLQAGAHSPEASLRVLKHSYWKFHLRFQPNLLRSRAGYPIAVSTIAVFPEKGVQNPARSFRNRKPSSRTRCEASDPGAKLRKTDAPLLSVPQRQNEKTRSREDNCHVADAEGMVTRLPFIQSNSAVVVVTSPAHKVDGKACSKEYESCRLQPQ